MERLSRMNLLLKKNRIMSTNTHRYSVIIQEYARRHFIKWFQKKYSGWWQKTLDTICFMLERSDGLRDTDKAEIIYTSGKKHIIKGNFSVVWTRESPKTSGNRYIAFIDDDVRICEVLLVYSKNDVVGNHETVWWQWLVEDNFPEIMKYFQ